LNIAKVVRPAEANSVTMTIQADVDAIRAAGGVPVLNHPNWQWAVKPDDILGIRSLNLFEVYNEHAEYRGVGGELSPEEIWDAVLSNGKVLYGVAADDTHILDEPGRRFGNPGLGWIEVRAASLSTKDILEALERGDFYASTGVALEDVQITKEVYAVRIHLDKLEKVTTTFLGEGGKILATSFDSNPVYKFTGKEKYVRARIDSSRNGTAWTQPVFVK
jgi:hypothetical protein